MTLKLLNNGRCLCKREILFLLTLIYRWYWSLLLLRVSDRLFAPCISFPDLSIKFRLDFRTLSKSLLYDPMEHHVLIRTFSCVSISRVPLSYSFHDVLWNLLAMELLDNFHIDRLCDAESSYCFHWYDSIMDRICGFRWRFKVVLVTWCCYCFLLWIPRSSSWLSMTL